MMERSTSSTSRRSNRKGRGNSLPFLIPKEDQLVKEATQTFVVATKKGEPPRTIRKGWRPAAKDKILKSHATFFIDVEETPVGSRAFTATAAPGERQAKPTDVSEYHVGGGWYQVGDEKVQGEEAARELLES